MGTKLLSNEILKRLERKNSLVSESLDSNNIMSILEELNIYEIELVAQNQELLEKESLLLETNKELENLFYDAPIPYIITDKKFNILKFNKQAQEKLLFNMVTPKYNNLMRHVHKKHFESFFKWIDAKKYEIHSLNIELSDKDKIFRRFKLEAKIHPSNVEWLMFSFIDIEQEYQILKEMEDLKNQLEIKNKQIDTVLNLQDNIVILTDSKRMVFANQKMFEFFVYRNMKDFLDKHECICEFFIEVDRFFHLGKILEGENWIKVMDTLPHSQRIVSMMDKNFSIHAFSVTINQYDKDKYIVTFNDITQTMLSHIELEDKSIHDKLTGSYNREFFEQNYQNIITVINKSEFKLAVAFLDIDYFKEVNDRYGHDIGDNVLKDFVSVIKKFSRDDDILIRWGGEEFILLLKVKTIDGLKKALEHLRVVVERNKFDTIGHITCSLGATIYENDEDIDLAIKRADIGVYEAKKNGRNQVVIK